MKVQVQHNGANTSQLVGKAVHPRYGYARLLKEAAKSLGWVNAYLTDADYQGGMVNIRNQVDFVTTLMVTNTDTGEVLEVVQVEGPAVRRNINTLYHKADEGPINFSEVK